MSAITPQTELRLLKCPLEEDNRNQLTFANETAQYNYFNSLPSIDCEEFTYQRKDSVIRFPAHIDTIIGYNYVMYRNENYTDKWFYAFITKMEYVNDNMTLITIKTDVYQTWQFDIVYKKCFVEREHVNDDTIGKNTYPENLEMGDYISTKLQPSSYTMPTTCFVVATTEQISTAYATTNQLLPIGLYYYGLTTIDGVQDLIDILDPQGRGDTVVAVFVTFKSFFSNWGTVTDVSGQVSSTVRFDYYDTIEIATVNYLGNDYIPKNNKLLTFPYSFLQVSNHTGQVINYHWENFNLLTAGSDGKIKFTIQGTITPGGSFKAFPLNYNNILNNHDDTIVMGKLPIGAYTNDTYQNWLAQNMANIGLNAVSSGLQVIGGVGLLASGAGSLAGAGNIASGILGVANTLGSIYQHSLVPDSVGGNVNSGDVNYTLGLINFEFKRMSIKNEYAKIIDDYFSTYGYKVNLVKLPNITGRLNWNYVKTIDCNLEGDIPEEDIQELKKLFNTGITFWHNPTNYLNYDVANTIV